MEDRMKRKHYFSEIEWLDEDDQFNEDYRYNEFVRLNGGEVILEKLYGKIVKYKDRTMEYEVYNRETSELLNYRYFGPAYKSLIKISLLK